jgi:hypothetical protein
MNPSRAVSLKVALPVPTESDHFLLLLMDTGRLRSYKGLKVETKVGFRLLRRLLLPRGAALHIFERGNMGPKARLCAVGDIGLSGRSAVAAKKARIGDSFC